MFERERIKAAVAAGYPIRDKRGQRRVALSNESINKTLVLLANILDTAVEHGLLAVAGELDRLSRSDQRIGRRPLIAAASTWLKS